MKNIIILLTAILTISISCNRSRDNSYDQILQEAKKGNKLILLDFSAEWCGGCKAYDKYIFQDTIINNKINEKFLLLKINKDYPQNTYLFNKYWISGLPHIVVIEPNENILGSISGFDSKYAEKPELFFKDITTIVDSKARIEKLISAFYSDTTNIESTIKLLDAYQSVNQYIEVQKLNGLLVRLNPTPERLFEFNFNRVIHKLKNEKNEFPLLSFLQENPHMDYNHK